MKLFKNELFKTTVVDNSSWITNFWFWEDRLLVTESLFDEEQNFFGFLKTQSFEDNLGFKKTTHLDFINHPDYESSSVLLASQSEVKPLEYSSDYLYNVFYDGTFYYVGYIKNDKVSGYTKIYNAEFMEQNYCHLNYLILGKLNNELLYISTTNRKVYCYQNESFVEFQVQNIKKVLNLKDRDLVLTTDYKLYLYQNNEAVLVYESSQDLEVALLNEDVIIISEKKTYKTFSLSLQDFQKQNLIINEYFFHLAVINNKILVGKPLFLHRQYEDYTLPLTFIQ